MIEQSQFPSMNDIRKMAGLLIEEIKLSGAVRLTKSVLVDRSGREVDANFLIIGNFTTVYHLENEIGFALYSDKSQRLFALSKLPGKRIEQKNTAYMKGQSEDVFMDISKGGALRQLTHQLNLVDQIPKGGPIVWPILGILIIAVLIVFERIIFILRKRVNADAFSQAICNHAAKGEWQECQEMCDKSSKKSIPKILKAGLECRNMSRIDMENALQESILNEIPSMERFLSTLGMLAAIAPLLGLLGTVTGMINTFHVITYYGTGDPRMMSGGISEALVTTMLGLSVAIPIMLVHTLLTRKIENEIAQMEEKAVSFVNMIFKNRD
ncbi:MAG: biopolymer transport protein ExbB [Candidatus Magnetoglobus multicellularis str. Araruama]|uniref:Biopolymer transport protein ExbB n=1 Tax=Candidatus Magnetoglobus multicellularis str. Araruama TaxID=890399 RepID=A0A1V1P963_9BACT|nr:MAG: biopolymer transport protein ExbB [Candidatus Magnetoglobus multicellularis str. Araruama]